MIINDYDIPKIYLNERDDGKLEVIDGQQRIGSITELLDNKFQLDSNCEYRKWSRFKKTKYNDLPENIKSLIENFEIFFFHCVSYLEKDQRELFLRFQLYK